MRVLETRSVRRICEVSLADRIRNKEIHRIFGTKENITVTMKKYALKWFLHIERESEKLMLKNIYEAKVYDKKYIL